MFFCAFWCCSNSFGSPSERKQALSDNHSVYVPRQLSYTFAKQMKFNFLCKSKGYPNNPQSLYSKSWQIIRLLWFIHKPLRVVTFQIHKHFRFFSQSLPNQDLTMPCLLTRPHQDLCRHSLKVASLLVHNKFEPPPRTNDSFPSSAESNHKFYLIKFSSISAIVAITYSSLSSFLWVI